VPVQYGGVQEDGRLLGGLLHDLGNVPAISLALS